MFSPNFTITPSLTNILMDIEASRQAISILPITLTVLTSLRESARLTATHYSTQIEGNCLTQEQVNDVIQGSSFPNRERDETEVKNYYSALEYLDELKANNKTQITEQQIKTIHGLVLNGKEKPTPYRDGQNVIRNAQDGLIVYMPPEAKDVAELMESLVDWINQQVELKELPVPIVAAIAHYQFATIHPYYDGNGRTARLLTNLILHKSGYGLKDIYSLEEYYARNLPEYYKALTIGDSHNYYFGRADADITKWVLYFCQGMAQSFAAIRSKATESASIGEQDNSGMLRQLDQRQKIVLSLFRDSQFLTTKEIANVLGVHSRTALNLCKKWADSGFLIQYGTANKSRKYGLTKKWEGIL
ncbi:MAG: Fic family protein [Alphaproteobacteria bacterium]|nr:Fic family protein [Alphaproteobacteria bacterium]